MTKEFAVMCAEGDRRVSWDTEDSGSVAVAEREFDTLKGAGYSPIAIGESGEGLGVVERFDKEQERVVFVAPIVGG